MGVSSCTSGWSLLLPADVSDPSGMSPTVREDFQIPDLSDPEGIENEGPFYSPDSSPRADNHDDDAATSLPVCSAISAPPQPHSGSSPSAPAQPLSGSSPAASSASSGPFESFPHGAPTIPGLPSFWTQGDVSSFGVRSVGYTSTRQKLPSEFALYDAVAADA